MILLFTRAGCAYCPGVKKYLEMKGVEFEVRDGDSGSMDYMQWANKLASRFHL